ncbi:unnamed protein product [Cuscuta europaea]|uniref:AP2/ERF domain-containing protein n=1 Tax=Cuscuta europaea TaxID=41803 RepID=A0A9P1DZT4_CUSEU|nr:unnamed protein product [Cuscuta europaea]
MVSLSSFDIFLVYGVYSVSQLPPIMTYFLQIESYTKELEEMRNLSKEEFLASLKRQSTGFSRGTSKYRGVSRHHHNRWEARINSATGTKYLYLGVFDTEEKAAAAYDIAAIQQRGPNALTNFDISNYADKLREIREAQSSAQPTEGGESSLAREAQQLHDAEGDRHHLLHNNRPAESGPVPGLWG